MIQHFTLTVNVYPGKERSETKYRLMAVCEERNEKWQSESLTAEQLRHALQGSQLSTEQVEEPINGGSQVTFKTKEGQHFLFLEDELRKMHLKRIPNG